MKIIHKSEIWKGHFTYLDGYDEDMYRSVEFTVEINIEDSVFTGYSWDEESRSSFNSPAKIKGFFDGDTVSFVMSYPCLYYKNENGQIELDKSKKHPEIHYYGRLSQDGKKISGEWEMTEYISETIDGLIESFSTGSFMIEKQS